MAKGFTIETIKRIYDDGSGEFVQICTDADSLDLVEIRQYDDKGKICGDGQARITMTVPLAEKVLEAFQQYMAGVKKEEQ